MNNKTCSKCGELKAFEFFWRQAGGKFGLRSVCKACLTAETLAYKKAHPTKIKAIQKKYRDSNQNKLKSILKVYYQENKDRLNKHRDARLENDEMFAIKHRFRGCITTTFRRLGYSKITLSHQILGADWKTVKAHFESRFTDGMSWENRKEWHIDHIIPMALAKTEEDAIKLNHYTNLRPLWAKDNRSKSDALPSNDELHQYGIDWLLKEIAA